MSNVKKQEQQRIERFVQSFSASIPFDRRLARYDIQGSIAYAHALAHARVLSESEEKQIVRGLEEILREIEEERFPFSVEDEDIHMNIERRLREKVGPVGGKLHTGRSRNEQISADLRLYLKEVTTAILQDLTSLRKVLVTLAQSSLGVIMPGYTHLQRAQPILFSHHLLAYYEMLTRDSERFSDSLRRVDSLPLGSGALAGTSAPIDREELARELGFSCLSKNSVDAVSDRDFVVEFLACCSLLMMHFSRLCEELILWSSWEFHFIRLPDPFCTGSSMMPQKRNPDVPELIRGKTGRVYGALFSLLTMMKSLPLAYNKDMQEDKEPLFDSIDTVRGCVAVLTEMLKGVKANRTAMRKATEEGYLLATDVADLLVKKGIPFREAHHIVGRIVRYCARKKKGLGELSRAELTRFSPHLDRSSLSSLTPEKSIERRDRIGGTARRQVLQRIKEIREKERGREEKEGKT